MHRTLADCYAKMNDFESEQTHRQRHLDIASKANDPIEKQRALNNLGTCYLQEGSGVFWENSPSGKASWLPRLRAFLLLVLLVLLVLLSSSAFPLPLPSLFTRSLLKARRCCTSKLQTILSSEATSVSRNPWRSFRSAQTFASSKT